LCVEEQFYLIWPVVVWLVRDRKRLLAISAIGCGVAFLLRVAMVLCTTPEVAERWIIRTLPFRMDDLLFGAMLALLLRGPAAHRVQRCTPWLFTVGAVGIVGLVYLSPFYASPWLLTFGLTLTAIASVGLIGMVLPETGRLRGVFLFKPARVLGKYSYGFYVWHCVWGRAWTAVLVYLEQTTHSLALAGLILLPLAFTTAFLLAKLSYDLFEVRFLGLKRHFEYESERRTHETAFAADGR
jgi:peptidoglycan/LPS O-acetylase OafA/YrhL